MESRLWVSIKVEQAPSAPRDLALVRMQTDRATRTVSHINMRLIFLHSALFYADSCCFLADVNGNVGTQTGGSAVSTWSGSGNPLGIADHESISRTAGRF